MKGVENGISLVGRYIEEAAGSLSKTVDNSLNKVYIGIANSYFGDTSDLNKVLAAITSDSRKHDALFRNFIADENAQQYPTGKKPETEIGVLPLLAALGVVAAAGVGTTVYSDDIQNAIEYIKLQAFGEPVVTVTGDSSALGLANLSPDPCEDTLSDACIKAVRIGNNPYLVYDGIYIYSQKGDEKYLNYVAATLEFAKEFSPVDYQFIKQWSKWIEINPNRIGIGAGGTGIDWGIDVLKQPIEEGRIDDALGSAVHESAHNSMFKTDMFGDEQYATEAAIKARENVSYVTKEMTEEFYREHLPDVEFKYPKWREQP